MPQAAIAQLGERQTEDLKIPGSIPGLGILISPVASHAFISVAQRAFSSTLQGAVASSSPSSPSYSVFGVRGPAAPSGPQGQQAPLGSLRFPRSLSESPAEFLLDSPIEASSKSPGSQMLLWGSPPPPERACRRCQGLAGCRGRRAAHYTRGPRRGAGVAGGGRVSAASPDTQGLRHPQVPRGNGHPQVPRGNGHPRLPRVTGISMGLACETEAGHFLLTFPLIKSRI